MTSLYDELHPLALQVEEARTKVVEAARAVVKANSWDSDDTKDLREGVKSLEEVQLALGLKTAQLLLSRPSGGPETVAGMEALMPDLPPGELEVAGPPQRPPRGVQR